MKRRRRVSDTHHTPHSTLAESPFLLLTTFTNSRDLVTLCSSSLASLVSHSPRTHSHVHHIHGSPTLSACRRTKTTHTFPHAQPVDGHLHGSPLILSLSTDMHVSPSFSACRRTKENSCCIKQSSTVQVLRKQGTGRQLAQTQG